jgi:hypothetical protein
MFHSGFGEQPLITLVLIVFCLMSVILNKLLNAQPCPPPEKTAGPGHQIGIAGASDKNTTSYEFIYTRPHDISVSAVL